MLFNVLKEKKMLLQGLNVENRIIADFRKLHLHIDNLNCKDNFIFLYKYNYLTIDDIPL